MNEWLVERNSNDELMLIRADITNTNTVSSGGAITHLEKLLNHKCHWDICQIHTNELPLQRLIKILDGQFVPKSGFTGPIGKLLHKVNSLPRNFNFVPLTDTEPLIQLSEDVIKNMSTDQHNCYLLVKALQSGNLTKELASLKCGLLSTSRWLTTGEALVILAMCDHGLTGENLRKFHVLLKFCVTAYFNLYFKIKVMHHLKYGPQHVVNSLIMLQSQTDEVKEIITSTIIRGSYHAHSESILTALLCSEAKEDREFAITTILSIRKGCDVGDMTCRQHKTPNINLGAKTVRELINWKNDKIIRTRIYL